MDLLILVAALQSAMSLELEMTGLFSDTIWDNLSLF